MFLSTDSTLTPDNVSDMLGDLPLKLIKRCLQVPYDRAVIIERQSQSVEQNRRGMIEWWLTFSPLAAWDLLAAEQRNSRDLEDVRSHLQKITGEK